MSEKEYTPIAWRGEVKCPECGKVNVNEHLVENLQCWNCGCGFNDEDMPDNPNSLLRIDPAIKSHREEYWLKMTDSETKIPRYKN